MSILFILSYLLLIDGSRYNVEFSSIDGDTLIAKRDTGQKFKIRLFGIDAPELNQFCLDKKDNKFPCGIESKEYLDILISGKDILCVEGFNKDKYGRILATCYSDQKNINMEMVKGGYAFIYGHSVYKKYQNEACESSINIWKGKVVIPQDYRKRILNYKNIPCNKNMYI